MAIIASSVCGVGCVAALCLVLGACGVAKAPPGWPSGEARPINTVPSQKAER